MPRVGLDRTAVVAASIEAINKDGLDSLTLSGLASKLGVRPPSLYNHIAGLEDLRAAVALRGISDLTDRMGRAAIGRTKEDALIAIAHAYRDFARDSPGLYLAAISWTLPGEPEHQRVAAMAVEIVTRVLTSYGLDGEDAIHATRALRSALHGFASLEGLGGFALQLDADESFEWLLEIVADGLDVSARVETQSA